MPARSHSETTRIRYLLGLCPQTERERIEAQYFEDEAAFQAMLAAEDDLIDAYARGELTEEETRRFETHFLSSVRGRTRVQFARALTGVVSSASPVETRPHATWLNIFESLRRWPLRIATAAVVIALVVGLSWLFVDRRRMSNDVRELRGEHVEVSKPVESLLRSTAAEQARNDRTALLPDRMPEHRDKPTRQTRAIATQRPRHLPVQTVDGRQDVANTVLGVAGRILGDERLVHEFLTFSTHPSEAPINTSDATLGNTFERQQIRELPVQARNVAGLLSLQPGPSASGAIFSLAPRSTANNGQITITVAKSVKSLKLRLALTTTAQHQEYHAAITTADGRRVTSIRWTEPLLPDRNSVDTPEIRASKLSSGDYVLLLSGKESDGSFVRVAEYSFRASKINEHRSPIGVVFMGAKRFINGLRRLF